MVAPLPRGSLTEHADIAFDSALMWGSWALRRLEPYITETSRTQLVRDLEAGTFRRWCSRQALGVLQPTQTSRGRPGRDLGLQSPGERLGGPS